MQSVLFFLVQHDSHALLLGLVQTSDTPKYQAVLRPIVLSSTQIWCINFQLYV